MLEHVRKHYQSTEYVAHEPVVMALYRMEDPKEFHRSCQEARAWAQLKLGLLGSRALLLRGDL